MKKYILIFILGLLGVKGTIAQNLKGRKSVGLRLSIANEFARQDTVFKYNLNGISTSIDLGFFLNKRWLLGVSYGWYRRRGNTINQFEINRVDNNWQVFARHHYWISKNVAFLIEPSINYDLFKADYHSDYRDSLVVLATESKTIRFDNKIGFLWVFKQRIVVDVSIPLIGFSYGVEKDTKEVFQNGITTIGSERQTYGDFYLRRDLGGLYLVSLGFKYLF